MYTISDWAILAIHALSYRPSKPYDLRGRYNSRTFHILLSLRFRGASRRQTLFIVIIRVKNKKRVVSFFSRQLSNQQFFRGCVG